MKAKKNMSKVKISVGAALCAVISLTLPSAVLSQGGAVTMDQTLRAVQQERRSVSDENRQREQRFLQQRNEQQSSLNRIRGEVRGAETESTRLEEVRNRNARALSELKAQLADRQGEFGELFGAARSAAADLDQQFAESLVSAQFPDRREGLTAVAQSDSLPTIEQLENLWFLLMQEASEQAKVAKFEAEVIGVDNLPQTRTVTRIGPFSAFTGGDFVLMRGESLSYLGRQPGGSANRAARDVESASGSGFVTGIVDPSLGTLLGMVVETPNMRERIEQGGAIGYAIMIVGFLGFLLGLYKWIMLTLTARKVNAQVASDQISEDNPLGRVMKVYEENRDADIETLQLKLDDAVLKELPSLDSGLSVVKVLAAVIPLMGLLGTVIGMIVTFQAITLFGTGDPKMMAGGISMALITTVQGLTSAIPLLILYTFASSAARRVSQTLEEQSAGMVAEYAERHGQAGQVG